MKKTTYESSLGLWKQNLCGFFTMSDMYWSISAPVEIIVNLISSPSHSQYSGLSLEVAR